MSRRSVFVRRTGDLPRDCVVYRPCARVLPGSTCYDHPDLYPHPLRSLYEDVVVGRRLPPEMFLGGISDVSTAVAAFVYLYPEKASFYEVAFFVDAICRFDRWGSVGACPTMSPDHLHLLRSVRSMLPSSEEQSGMVDGELVEILSSAVRVLDRSFVFKMDMDDVPGLDVLYETERFLAFACDDPDAWDAVFASGKVVGMQLRDRGEGITDVAVVRRSVLVDDLDLRGLRSSIDEVEPGWTSVSPLSVSSPTAGTRVGIDRLLEIVVGHLNC